MRVSEIREYCLTEYFNATCPRPNDVILMTSAVYGRMRLGRCIRGDYNLGCSNDVIGLFDAQCSGRRACDVSVRTLVDIRPCQRDFASYLEASYTCITGTYAPSDQPQLRSSVCDCLSVCLSVTRRLVQLGIVVALFVTSTKLLYRVVQKKVRPLRLKAQIFACPHLTKCPNVYDKFCEYGVNRCIQNITALK